MKDWNEADRRLVDWLKERTDVELQRLLDAPEDGLTNDHLYVQEDCACMAGWAFGLTTATEAQEFFSTGRSAPLTNATTVLCWYGLMGGRSDDDGTVFRHIKAFVAAELLTRRVDWKALPAPRETAHA